MPAIAEERTVRVKARCSFANPGWSCEKGDEVEVSVSDARRMIQRGLAESIKGQAIPEPTLEELEAAKVVEVATVSARENTAVVRPLRRK